MHPAAAGGIVGIVVIVIIIIVIIWWVARVRRDEEGCWDQNNWEGSSESSDWDVRQHDWDAHRRHGNQANRKRWQGGKRQSRRCDCDETPPIRRPERTPIRRIESESCPSSESTPSCSSESSESTPSCSSSSSSSSSSSESCQPCKRNQRQRRW
jgi:FtsZ-interacting cell division protein ZipA